MKTQALTLALAAIALFSSAANAQSRYSYSVNGNTVMTNSAVLGNTTVLTQPAVLGDTTVLTQPAVIGGVTLGCEPLFGDRTFYDHDVDVVDRGGGLLSGLFGSDNIRTGVTTYSAVIPTNQVALPTATRICGQQKANELFSLRLFGFGLGFGKINPDADMRPMGSAM